MKGKHDLHSRSKVHDAVRAKPRRASLHDRVQQGKAAKEGIQLYTIEVKQQLSIVNVFREHVHR